MHSIHNKYAPPSLHNLWPKNSDRDLAIELRNASNYIIPKHNYAFFTRFPAYTLPKLWNDYNGTSKLHDNPFTFKICLKKELQNSDSYTTNPNQPPLIPIPPLLPPILLTPLPPPPPPPEFS